MHVDPPLATLFAVLSQQVADAQPADLDERRRQADGTMLLLHRPEPGVVSSDHNVPVPGGVIRIRVTRPLGDRVLPALYFIHGGGWFQGNLDTAEVECGPIASAVECVVVSVEYRLAPEHHFPVPLEDVVAGWTWLHAKSSDLGIDPARVAVGGTSAGGNLAAALCLAARDRSLPQPILQLLDVPALDLTGASPSLSEFSAGAGLTGEQVLAFARDYCGDTPATEPLISPLLAPDLSGLPPAVVIVSELDPVRDDGERWVQALQRAGVPAAGLRVLTHVHGSWIIPLTITSVVVADLHASVLRRAFAGELHP